MEYWSKVLPLLLVRIAEVMIKRELLWRELNRRTGECMDQGFTTSMRRGGRCDLVASVVLTQWSPPPRPGSPAVGREERWWASQMRVAFLQRNPAYSRSKRQPDTRDWCAPAKQQRSMHCGTSSQIKALVGGRGHG